MVAPSPNHPDPSPLTGPLANTESPIEEQSLTMLSDVFAEEDTAWLTYQGTFRVCLRYVDSALQRKITKRLESLASGRQRRRAAQNPGNIYTNESSAVAYSELVIIEWDGLHDKVEGKLKEIKFTPEIGIKLCRRNIDFLNWVSDQAADPANFLEKEDTPEQEKK